MNQGLCLYGLVLMDILSGDVIILWFLYYLLQVALQANFIGNLISFQMSF